VVVGFLEESSKRYRIPSSNLFEEPHHQFYSKACLVDPLSQLSKHLPRELSLLIIRETFTRIRKQRSVSSLAPKVSAPFTHHTSIRSSNTPRKRDKLSSNSSTSFGRLPFRLSDSCRVHGKFAHHAIFLFYILRFLQS
jgi:hypothetical protein